MSTPAPQPFFPARRRGLPPRPFASSPAWVFLRDDATGSRLWSAVLFSHRARDFLWSKATGFDFGLPFFSSIVPATFSEAQRRGLILVSCFFRSILQLQFRSAASGFESVLSSSLINLATFSELLGQLSTCFARPFSKFEDCRLSGRVVRNYFSFLPITMCKSYFPFSSSSFLRFVGRRRVENHDVEPSFQPDTLCCSKIPLSSKAFERKRWFSTLPDIVD